MSTRAVETWTLDPLKRFVSEAGARLVLLMTPAGQVMAQHGFSRAVDVMSAAALGAAIMASTAEIARQLNQPPFAALTHQGERHGIFLGAVPTNRGTIVALVVYDLDASSAGLVQLFFEQLATELQAASPKEGVPKQVLAADFERELSDSLNTLFGEIAVSLVNFDARITCKIVLRSRASGNDEPALHLRRAGRVTRAHGVARDADRPHAFFDFLPIDLGLISGFSTRFQLYTVRAGSVTTRRGGWCSGGRRVVFVADSQARQLDENIESPEPAEQPARDGDRHPHAPGRVAIQQAGSAPRAGAPGRGPGRAQFPRRPGLRADALHGRGVQTLKGISELVLKRLSAGSAV
jgi:hypothetical protein